MTLGMIIFVVTIFVWLGIGFLMLCKAFENSEGVNWFGVVWIVIIPFIPIIAKNFVDYNKKTLDKIKRCCYNSIIK